MLIFPRVPEVFDGMALSAATLNSYHRGLQYLLARTREPELVSRATSTWSSTTATDFTTIWTLYGPLEATDLYINAWFRAPWYAQLQYYGDDDGWHTVWSDDDVSDYHLDTTLDLSAETHLTIGNIYTWRWQLKTSSGNAAYGAIWRTAVQKTLTGWTAPTTFANAATSGEDDFNDLRDDILALRDWLPDYGHLQGSSAAGHYVDVSLWHTFFAGCQQWVDGQGLYLSAEFKGWVANGDQEFTWGVDIAEPTRSGDYWVTSTIYSRDITWAEIQAGSGEYVRFETTLNPGDLSGYTPGEYYKIFMWVYLGGSAEAGNDIWCRQPIVSRGAPAISGSWPTLTDWAHGDDDAGETRLNLISDALALLYPGGDQELRSELPMTNGTHGAILHARPWLVYMVTTGQSPTLRYGADYLSSYSLPSTEVDEIVSFDLSQIAQLPLGSRYLLDNITLAMEAEAPYAEA